MNVLQATLKEVSGKEKELNVVMTMGQSLNNKCVEEDGTVIAKLLEELHAKWDHLNTLLTQRKVIHKNIITISNIYCGIRHSWRKPY